MTWTFAQLETCCDVLDVLTHINTRRGLNAGPGNFCWNLWVKDHFTHYLFFLLLVFFFVLFCFFFFFLDVNLPLLHLPLLQPSSLHLGCTVYTEKKQKTKSKTKGRAIFLPGGICRTQWVCVYINIYIIYINIYNTDFKKKIKSPQHTFFFNLCQKCVFRENLIFILRLCIVTHL